MRIDPALDDAETGASARERCLGLLRPAHRERERGFDLGFGRRVSGTFIENHLDVGAEQALDLHGAFG